MDSKQINEFVIKRSKGLSDSIKQFNELSEKIETFLTYDSNNSEKYIDLTKSLFDFNKQLINESISKDSTILSIKSSLDELYTNGFDEEQVWQQIQLNNQPILDLLVKEVANVSVEANHFTPLFREDNVNNETKSMKTDESFEITEQLISDDESDDHYLDDEEGDEDEKVKEKKVRIIKPIRKSIVDDKFFKLQELEEFLNKEDIREERKISGSQELMSDESEEEIDYFEDTNELTDDEEEDDGKDAMFSDFFDGPIDQINQQKSDELSDGESDEEVNDEIDTRDVDINKIEDNNKNNGFDFDNYSSDESDEQLSNKRKSNRIEDSDQNKSEFEKCSETLNEKIAKQERLNLIPKSWQMSGEIVSDKRPENSLLEEHLHFDHTTRPAPLITEETTVKLEDIIRQRVKDNAFDDVVRKVKPKEKPFEYKRRITMESEKSKQSLAQIYENEYIKQKQNESEEQQNPIHLQIQRLMRNLFVRLDALSNFNFTPRAPQPEVKIINNLPAITAEEVTPLTVSDVSLLAPQEVFNNQKRELQTNAEQTETDRKRSRRVKKKIQSKKAKYNESKQQIKTKSTEKESNKSWSETKHLSSSKKFFEKLHEKNTEVVKKKFEKKVSAKQSNKMKL